MFNSLLETLQAEMEHELDAILQWWSDHTQDPLNGGFYGKIDGHNQLVPSSDKGVILNTRILWTFSAAARLTGQSKFQSIAQRAYDYLCNHFIDTLHGGLYWMLNHTGDPIDRKKQIYAQSFAIYGMSEYFLLTKEQKALNIALDLFQLIEKHSYDTKYGGYLEAFTQEWQLIDDLRLSDKDANEVKTMNTHLHILEAYTNLYRAAPNEQINQALRKLISCHIDKFIDAETGHLKLFFDEQWTSKSDAISYGHDIECSWLLLEAAEVLGDTALIDAVKKITLKMAEATLHEGRKADGSVIYEKDGAHYDLEKHWWVQAEAVVGFYNAYQMTNDTTYLNAAIDCWAFIKSYIIDKDKKEWHWSIREDGSVNKEEDKAGPWKAPYHNGRMCMEIIHRISSLNQNLK